MSAFTDAAHLSRTNLMYRRPELYDQLTEGDDLAHQAARAATQHHNAVRSVLDLGCGTGRDLEIFRTEYGWSGVGIDLQPQLVNYARAFRPELDVHVGDIRTVRLGRAFDLITCLGNSLAYLHTDAELAAAAATFADHAWPGTLLIIGTLTEPPTRRRVTSTLTPQDGTADKVEIVSDWDPTTKLHTTRRRWTLPDGSSETDHLVRRVTEPDELADFLSTRGFRVLSTNGQICAIYHPAERMRRESDGAFQS